MARPSVSEKYADHLASLLEAGEELTGVCAASEQQSVFKGRGVLLAVTDRRLLVAGLDRRGRVAGDPISIAPGDIDSAEADGAGGNWAELTAAVMDRSAGKVRLKLRDGGKHKFLLMRGTGPLGALGGGEEQSNGVEALAAFLARAE